MCGSACLGDGIKRSPLTPTEFLFCFCLIKHSSPAGNTQNGNSMERRSRKRRMYTLLYPHPLPWLLSMRQKTSRNNSLCHKIYKIGRIGHIAQKCFVRLARRMKKTYFPLYIETLKCKHQYSVVEVNVLSCKLFYNYKLQL